MPFDPILDLTIVVGIDAKTIRQLEISHQTWRLHRPEMWSIPWIVFYDRDQLEYHAVKAWLRDRVGLTTVELVPWPPPAYVVPYESQREKMLTGHVFVPAQWVQTPWYLKIDTDCVATGKSEWTPSHWFDDTHVLVAPRWRYTKGAFFLDRLDAWGNSLTEMLQYPAPDIPRNPGQVRVGHARFCSWLSFYRTAFARQAACLCQRGCGEYRLPVPSQDTMHWYVAARMDLPMRIESMKARLWENHSRSDALQMRVAEILCNEKATTI